MFGASVQAIPQAPLGMSATHVIVAPNGYRGSWNIHPTGLSQLDDVSFVHRILDRLATFPNVNVSSTTLFGLSNGGSLVNRVLIESDDVRIVAGVTIVNRALLSERRQSHTAAIPWYGRLQPGSRGCGAQS